MMEAPGMKAALFVLYRAAHATVFAAYFAKGLHPFGDITLNIMEKLTYCFPDRRAATTMLRSLYQPSAVTATASTWRVNIAGTRSVEACLA